MQIDFTNLTPWASLAGGVTIGLAAAAMLLLSGRTLGISGIFFGALTGAGSEFVGGRPSYWGSSSRHLFSQFSSR
jgi:hypothetical protein